MSEDDRISITELGEIFGEHIPMEAFRLLAHPQMGESTQVVRMRLRQIAGQHSPRAKAMQSLVGRIRSWVEEHDLKHSEAVAIADEVLAAFRGGEGDT